MKIIYLSNSKIPSRTANSINVMKMCQAFVQNGHEVILLIPDHQDVEPNVHDPYEFYGVDPCFKIKKLPRKIMSMEIVLKYNSIVSLYVRLHRPDLIFARCHSLKYSLSTIGQPVVLDAHKLITKDNLQLSELIHSQHFRRLVVTCETLRESYQKLYDIPNSLIRVAHNGADGPKSFEKLDLGSPARLQVGYVGHLYPWKGMEIISELAKSCSWADFHIIGGTEPDLDHWKSNLKRLGNIFFYGFLPPSKTDRYRQSVDVLVAPYQHYVSSDGSGVSATRSLSPLKIFEYMAAGKAIMASDSLFIREVLDHKVTAWLCDPEEPKSWISGLTYLRDNPELQNSLGLKAREKFKANYTWKIRASNVIEGLI